MPPLTVDGFIVSERFLCNVRKCEIRQQVSPARASLARFCSDRDVHHDLTLILRVHAHPVVVAGETQVLAGQGRRQTRRALRSLARLALARDEELIAASSGRTLLRLPPLPDRLSLPRRGGARVGALQARTPRSTEKSARRLEGFARRPTSHERCSPISSKAARRSANRSSPIRGPASLSPIAEAAVSFPL